MVLLKSRNKTLDLFDYILLILYALRVDLLFLPMFYLEHNIFLCLCLFSLSSLWSFLNTEHILPSFSPIHIFVSSFNKTILQRERNESGSKGGRGKRRKNDGKERERNEGRKGGRKGGIIRGKGEGRKERKERGREKNKLVKVLALPMVYCGSIPSTTMISQVLLGVIPDHKVRNET